MNLCILSVQFVQDENMIKKSLNFSTCFNVDELFIVLPGQSPVSGAFS